MKKYCISFRVYLNLIDNFKGWYIELTDNFNGYNLESDKYGKQQVFNTEKEAINSVLELQHGRPYIKIGY